MNACPEVMGHPVRADTPARETLVFLPSRRAKLHSIFFFFVSRAYRHAVASQVFFFFVLQWGKVSPLPAPWWGGRWRESPVRAALIDRSEQTALQGTAPQPNKSRLQADSERLYVARDGSERDERSRETRAHDRRTHFCSLCRGFTGLDAPESNGRRFT